MTAIISRYKIRQAVELTGASEFLIRIWEVRYQAIKPFRTKTGRRLYSENDILKIRNLLTLTQQGHRIGDIAQKSLSELNRISQIEMQTISAHFENPTLKKIFKLLDHGEWDLIRKALLDLRKKEQPIKLIHHYIEPILSEVGRRVNSNNFSIAQEHILSSILKECVLGQIQMKGENHPNIRFVFAAPEGDFHDLGLSIAYSIARSLKISSLFLGAHMPKSELASVCIKYGATHLILSSTVGKDSGSLDEYLEYIHFLDRNLDSKITLWTAGKNALRFNLKLNRHFKVFDSFVSFESDVKRLY